MKRLSIAVILPLVFLSACSSTPAAPDRECLGVTPEILQEIADGADSPITPVAGVAVLSKEFKGDVWIVAMEFASEGVDNQTGAWAVSTIEPGIKTILATDGIANNFTHWPSEINGEKLNTTVDGVDSARACLNR